MSYLAKSRRPSNTVLRLFVAYLVLTSALPVRAAVAVQAKAKASLPTAAPARPKSAGHALPADARAPKDRVTPSALQANGKIAFTSDRDGNKEIYVMNPDGSGQTNITNHPADDLTPSFRPDGSKIVFESVRDGNDEIYVMNADGSGQTNITNNANFDYEPAFSPDGGKIVFTSERSGNAEVHLMNADGSGVVNLSNHPNGDAEASFSPDGSKIVFVSTRDGGDGEIYVMNADGTNQTRLTTTGGGSPAFSPDGSKITYTTGGSGISNAIVVMNADGTNRLQLTNNTANDEDSAFSPDGTKIVFASDRDGNFEIYTMNPDGTAPTRLTNNAANDSGAAWQTLLSCAPLPPNGVAWYRAEDTAQDEIGANDGTFLNGATTGSGFVGTAFEFDGVDDMIDIGQLTDLQNAQQLTVMAWVKKRDLNNTIAGIIGKWNGCTGCTDDTFLLYNNESFQQNKGGFVVRFTDDTAAAVAGTTDIPVGQWVHIAATWRSSDGEIKIYKNGRLDGSGTGGANKTLKYHTNYTAKIGEWGEGHGGNPVYRFGGAIDEATIFNRALSQTEIRNVYDARNEGKCLASAAQTITASNTNDSGPGSLRQAILDANASPGLQTIDFNIPGAGVRTINLASPLPDITDPVVIDGYTQAGASVNTLATGNNAVLLIELNGAGAGAGADGLRLNANGSTVRGLVINRFNDIGIVLNGGDNNVISGNFIGTDPTGLVDLGNGDTGIEMESANADNNLIGGTTPAARNIISGNNNSGIEFEGASTGNIVQGNFIGLAADGTTALGNFGYGVLFDSSAVGTLVGGDDLADGTADGVVGARNYIAASNLQGVFVGEITGVATVQGNYIGTDTSGTLARGNGLDGVGVHLAPGVIIGGSTAGAGNLISANGDNGVSISNTNGVSVKGNRIGTQADGVSALGNTSSGVYSFFNATNARIGGTAAGEANVIAFNASNGVSVDFSVTAHVISANSIHSNGSTAANVGIDLGFDGLTPNDAGDADTGANNIQNFPFITSATVTGGQTNITGTLNSTPNTSNFRLEFFSNTACDPSGNGEGKTFIGTTSVNTDASGNAPFNLNLPPVAVGSFITATATDANGNTSEFSACQTVVAGASTNISWINPAGGAWNVAANWQDGNGVNRVPTASDDVIIDLAGTYTITLGSAVTVNTINLGAASGTQTLEVSGFSLTLNSDSVVNARGVLVVNQTLNGAGNLNVIGTLEHRGTISGAGTVNIVSGATLNIGGSQPTLSRTLNNGGTTNYAATNSFVFANGRFNNLPSGLFNVGAEKLIFQSGGTNLFSNAGTIRKATGTGTTTFFLPFNNSGTVDLLSGALDFGVSGTSSGQFNGAAGTTLSFNNQTLTAGSLINVPTLVISGGTNSIAGTYNVSGTSTISGTVTITGNVSNVGSLLDIDGRVDFNSNNIVAPTITIDGVLAGSANVSPTATGTINFNGTMVGTGATNIPAGATLNIGGSQPQLLRTINNSGTANYNVSNSFVFSNGTFINLPGATFNVQVERLIFTSGGTNLFSNTGTLRKATGTATTNISVPFNNNGTVDLQTGTLEFGLSGGTSTNGAFNGAANTTFRFTSLTLQAAASVTAPNVVLSGLSNIAGTYNVSAGTSISGTANFSGNILNVGNTLDIFGTANFNSNNITAQTITVNGLLSGTANVSPNASGTFNFNGTMSGAGATNIPAGATLNIGGSQPQLQRTLNNSGTAIYNSVNSLVFSGGTFNNLAGGSFDARADNLIFASGGTNLFSNAGTLEKTQGAGTTNFNLNVTNTGTVEAKSGTLGFNAVYNQSAGTTRLNGGNLSTTTLLNIQGGMLSGAGTITGHVQNAATLAPGLSPGILNITGNYTQLASGTLAVEIGGTTAGSQHDQLNVSGTATLDGTLSTTLTGGYNPGFNDQIIVLTYGTRSGAFGTVNAPSFTPVYNANNLTLVSNAPAPATLLVTNTNDSGAGSLRQAILDSNAMAGTQAINFQIPAGGVQSIVPATILPAFDDPVVIDGYTQPGASVNTLASGTNAVLLIELVGPGAGGSGLQLRGGDSTVRGLIINRFNNSAAININTGNNNRVEGCFLGTDANGTAKFADESREGVSINASTGNVVGGTTPAARNLISGHRLNGINIFGSGAGNNLVQGNLIGTDKTGAVALGNGQAGVSISGFSGNVVGGTTAAARNIISGNNTGLQMFTGSNTVQGNYIGTDASGTIDLGNSGVGLFMQGGASNLIGGLTQVPGQAPGNIISGNGSAGIDINGNDAPGHTIQGNLVGVDVSGASALPNNGDGISIRNTGGGNLVGDDNAAGRNVVSGNTAHGISLNNDGNRLRNNYVGVGSDGAAALGNTQNGVLINSRDNNALTNNRIAFNGQDGIALNFFNTGTNNSFLANSIFSNTGLGIDLGNNGLTVNDAGDADAGANNLQNFPVVSSAIFSNGATNASGTLNSTANTTFTLEFFANAACDNNGHGEGQTLAGTTSVTTDAGGNATFSLVLSNAVVAGQFITATATDPTGNTSEFGACAQVSAAPGTFTISGQVTEGANGLGGVTMTLSGSQSATTTTDAGGNYSFANLAGGNYVVTPSRANYTFAPPSRTFNNLSANQTANFTATLNAVTISGQVTENGAPLSGVTITLSGTQSGTATTDASGNYAFNVPSGGDYVITPSRTHYTFNPSGQAVSNLGNNLTANFAATRNTHSIGGQIRDNNNAPLAGVNVNLSGDQTATTTTDANGNYSFANLAAGGNYIVTPQFANYAFAPPSAPFNNLSANSTANFTGTPGAHTISGRVADASNNPLANVTVTLSGAQSGTALTDASGNYAFNVAAGASYTVTPSRANYTFAPPSASFANIASNQTANFTGTLQTFSIGGRVSDGNNNGVAGVNVALSGGQAANTTTDAAGNYSFANLPAGANYTVTPARAGYTFTPANATFNNLSANATANFLASTLPTQPQPVSGRVLDNRNGGGISNVTLYVTDATTGANVTSTTTDANGNYTLLLPPGGDYTITTAKAGLTFQPAARTFDNLSGGQTSDFMASEGLSISGRVAGQFGNGIGNVIVTLSGTVSRTTLTLPNGSFLFNNLPANGNYTVQADSGLLIFNPLQVSRSGLASDVTLNLVAAPRAVPVPTPPIEDGFDGTTRDPLKFTEGTLTQAPGSKDPQVLVVQEGGKLKITPRDGTGEASFNGYVTTRAIDFTDATASVEVNQTADNGAQTIFAVGRDERNYFRFVAEDVEDSPVPASKAGGVTGRALGLRRLIFQARSAGVLNGLPPSVPYDPIQHRYWRFRHSSAESAMFFETSADRVVWKEQRRVALAGPIGLLAAELSAGTNGSVANAGQAIFDNLSVQPNTFINRANNIRLAQSAYRVSEGAGFLTLKATRAGDTSKETRIDYASEPHDGKPCNTQDGKGRARCDFGTTAGTIRFAPGETEKTFTIYITDDVYAEGDETVRVALGFPSAGVVEEPVSALVTIADNDAGATPHPINTAPFLVRQQYLDFLNREPDADGFNAWVGVLGRCAYEGHFGPGKSGSDPACDRITVSSSFFRSSEFQFKGYFVYRFYKASLGRVPTYEEFLRDMTSVTGQTEAEVVARREAYANAWVERPDFVALNEGITNAEFVDQLATTAGVPIVGRAQLISDLNEGRKTRAQVLRVVVDSPELFNREYNAAFVLMQYFGYLQRDPDETGYNNWLNLLNRTGDYRTMIFGFLYSQEYILRFGQP